MNKLLIEVGEALYGPRWQSEIARALGVSDRTVRRWVQGQNAVPKGVYADLNTLVQDRSAVLHALAWSGRLFSVASNPRED
jgi:predicted transcriptional regulator